MGKREKGGLSILPHYSSESSRKGNNVENILDFQYMREERKEEGKGSGMGVIRLKEKKTKMRMRKK